VVTRYNVYMRIDESLAHVSAAAFLVVSAFVASVVGLGWGVAYAEEVEDSRTKAEILEEESQAAQEARTSFSVNPVVANEKAKRRDIIKKELTVTNNSRERIGLRASVENIDPNSGAEEFVSPGAADLSSSLANWIEITRGVITLAPGETRKIPYLIHVNLSAEPGAYFARINFTDGSPKPPESEHIKEDGTSLLLNVEVLDDARERLQLGSFVAEDSLVMGDNVGFSYQVENVGNRVIEPRGSIRIFNRRGEEVGSVPLNADGLEVTPENKQLLAAAWSAAGRFGKYKAFLDLEYGENQLASVQDTVYFWVFPWKEILATIVGVLVLAVVGTFVIHMRTVARPVRVQSGGTYEPAYEPSRTRKTASVAMPSQTRQAAPVSQAAYDTQGATVLQSRRVSGTPTAQFTEERASAQPVAPRPQTQGNVVQLAPRR
jgi:hypothetical protein